MAIVHSFHGLSSYPLTSALCRSLTDDRQAWHVTQHVPIPDFETVAKTHGIKRKRPVKHVRHVDEVRGGPRVVLEDQLRSSGWVLAAHGGFMTHFHHDAEGFGTFMVFNCGAKIWALCEPRLQSTVLTREELFENLDSITQEESLEGHVVGTLILERGDVL